jgi:hypothetical protein
VLQEDGEGGRTRAILKRLLQVASHMSAAFAAGALYIASEVLVRRPDVRASVTTAESVGKERAVSSAAAGGVPHADKGGKDGKGGKTDKSGKGGKASKGVGTAGSSDGDRVVKEAQAGDGTYDMTKRDPRYAGADSACLWELTALAAHYHPSVRKFAEHLMSQPRIPMGYDGDPLSDFSVR